MEKTEYIDMGATNTIKRRKDYYLFNSDYDKTNLEIRALRKKEIKLCFLDILEFVLEKSSLCKKINSGSFEDLDFRRLAEAHCTFNKFFLKEFKSMHNLSSLELNNYLKEMINNGFLTEKKWNYQFTEKVFCGNSISDLDSEKYSQIIRFNNIINP